MEPDRGKFENRLNGWVVVIGLRILEPVIAGCSILCNTWKTLFFVSWVFCIYENTASAENATEKKPDLILDLKQISGKSLADV